MDLHQVVPAALQAINLLVRHALGQGREFGVLAEEVVAVEAAILGGKGLHLPIDRGFERAHQCAGQVAGEQAVPVAAPDQLDHVPASTREQALQLVDDAAVAAHGAIQPLQVAVDHPDQVVQALARGQGQRTHALGLVHLAIAEHAPDLAVGAIQQVAVREVTHEARVVNAADGADAHRARGELPEVRHQPRVRVARQPLRARAGRHEFLAVVLQVMLAQAPFQKRARIHARRAVGLEEHQVAPVLAFTHTLTCTEEMVEAALEQVGRARITGDVATQFAIRLVRAHHHGQRVPAHDGSHALFDGQVAGEHGLVLYRHGVHVRRVQVGLPANPLRTRHPHQLLQHVPRPLGAFGGNQGQKGVAPFGGLLGVSVGQGILGMEQMGRQGGVHRSTL
ncbi:hypothetical protein D3C71_1189810 [compost metagenome]